jgi:hypothetical protein
MTTREEHLAWCKDRALEYVNAGDITNAVASMGSDLNKHPETRDHSGIMLGLMLRMSGNLSDPQEARQWIEGFR